MTLYEAIKAKGWTVCHTADLAGVNRLTLQRIAQGKFFPSLSTVSKLIDVLQSDIEFEQITSNKIECIACSKTTITRDAEYSI